MSTLKSFRLSQRAVRTTEQPISYLMAEALRNPGLISLAAGFVDYQTLPTHEAADLLGEILSDPASGRAALQYGTTAGSPALRQRLLEHLAALDAVGPDHFAATADDLVISTGSQQLLFILTDVLIDPGDIVITEWPSYFVYTGTLESAGAVVRGVDMDERGLVPAKLEELLAELTDAGQLHRVKMIYTCDYHQNPTGITLSAERRGQLLDLVRRYSADPTAGGRILLLEDAAYRELTYEGTAPPSIKRDDTGNEHVALLQTFSKPFSPGLKTGYGLLPRDLVEPVLLQKGNHDFGSVNLVQEMLLRAMKSGLYHRHVRELCAAYAAKRDAMLAALEEHLGDFAPARSPESDGTHWTHPSGGLYVYLTLPSRIHTGRHAPLFQEALREGVLYVPGGYCYGPDATRKAPVSTIRLSFGVPTVAQIREGVSRLAKAIRRSAR